MVAIQGIGGVPEPKPERPAKVRDVKEREVATSGQVTDGLVVSSEAQAAAKLAQLIKTASEESEVRAERVDAARQSIERGEYRNPEVVAKVAERISKYLP